MTVRVRKAVGGDLPRVLDLYAQLSDRNGRPEGPRVPAAWAAMLAQPGMHVLIAEVRSEVVGTLTVTFLPNLTRGVRPYGVIENVVVDASMRGEGVSQALMEAAESLARQQEAYKLMLMTGRVLEGAQAFYTRCGYDGSSKVAFEKRF